jgi:ATP-dependent RNA helicase RhlB
LLKKIIEKFKKIYGSKTKSATAPVIKSKTDSKTESKTSARTHKPHQEVSSEPRAPRKKETPEEYKNRHESRAKKAPDSVPVEKVPSSEPWDASVFRVPAEEGKTRFHDLKISEQILHAIFDLQFNYCTPVQAEVLPKALEGEDITAQAQTGTGKTAAFLVTIFNHIIKFPLDKKRKHGTPRALILAPTRELVLQIEKDARGLGTYVDCSILSLLGGMDYEKQQKILKSSNCDILICTPGRLIDFMRKKLVDLGKVEILIIDEADRMLDMGFIPSVKQIVNNVPSKAKRQTMFFSATLTGDVKRLAESWTRQAFEVTVKPENIAVQSVEQITYITTIAEKPTLIYNVIMQKNLERVLVFVNRRHVARKLKETFEMYGISCALLSGEVDQAQRIKRLERFREGKIRVLVATDVASRGIHVAGISHVINYNMPQDVEEYVHRIGRTGRAGASGISINFADEEDSYELQKLEEYLGKKIECIYPEEELLIPIPAMYQKKIVSKHQEKDSKPKKYGGPRRRRQ